MFYNINLFAKIQKYFVIIKKINKNMKFSFSNVCVDFFDSVIT